MSSPERRSLPVFPLALGAAVLLLGSCGLGFDIALYTLPIAFLGSIALITVITKRRGGRGNGRLPGRHAAGASSRALIDVYSISSIWTIANLWAVPSGRRRPRYVYYARDEMHAWEEVGRRAGLDFECGRSLRLSGAIRGVEIRVDPVQWAEGYETRAWATLPIRLEGRVTAAPTGDSTVVIEGAHSTLEKALRESPVIGWLVASDDAVLEIERRAARAFAPEIVGDADLLRGLIEAAVCAAETVTAWSGEGGGDPVQ